MKNKIVFLPIFVLTAVSLHALSASSQENTNVQKVIIIRHGEKPSKGDNLSCAGFNRALKLRDVLDKKVGEINAIFVPSLDQGKSTDVARMYQTAIPYAVKHDLPINTKFDVTDEPKLADAIKKQNGTVLVIWEHSHIDNIARELGIKDPGKWNDSDYDSMWIISFKNKKTVMEKEEENISPSQKCQ